ncbi:ABC transporter ATP-binding protein [Exiguobacterium flavidum]|uniref:ABC transporter ATP-binding protein n=1 Tax=Exiguobacterium flavidum TaxID=2184695 RepID=UPI000DF83554|nr:ABC transporter ATP-binding protein [Exiguobacterium flavidum]
MIRVERLSKKFDDNVALKEVTFELQPGCTSLLGPNGAGKTTLLHLLAGITRPTTGRIDGLEQARIGFLPQTPALYPWMTARETLEQAGLLSGRTVDVHRLLGTVGLTDSKKPVRSYSGGMKQRLGLAQALCTDPDLLLLDEPVSALDPAGRREVLDLLMELKRDRMILYSTHVLPDAEEASDHVLILKEGRLIKDGTIRELLHKQQLTVRFTEEVDASELLAISCINHLEQRGLDWHLSTDDIKSAERALLQKAIDREWSIESFHIGHHSLESYLLEVTK